MPFVPWKVSRGAGAIVKDLLTGIAYSILPFIKYAAGHSGCEIHLGALATILGENRP